MKVRIPSLLKQILVPLFLGTILPVCCSQSSAGPAPTAALSPTATLFSTPAQSPPSASLSDSSSPRVVPSGEKIPSDPSGPSDQSAPDSQQAAGSLQAPGAPSAPASQKSKVKAGSIDDVAAVGNREIGGRGMGNWYSTETEIKMGRLYAAAIEKSTRFITDPVITEYVNRIGQNIVKNSDCKVPFTIKIIDSDEINAFALPGGFFFVNSGLILNADAEAELAGVMAHETAHVCAHHAVREQTRLNYLQFGAIPLIFVGGWSGFGIYEGASVGVPVTFMRYSRAFEAQADYLGLQYMYRAGYDPQAFIRFFEKVQALEKRRPGAVAKAFAYHPQTPERILRSQEEIATILPRRANSIVTTPEFATIKDRLQRFEDLHRSTGAKGASNSASGLHEALPPTDNKEKNTGIHRDEIFPSNRLENHLY